MALYARSPFSATARSHKPLSVCSRPQHLTRSRRDAVIVNSHVKSGVDRRACLASLSTAGLLLLNTAVAPAGRAAAEGVDVLTEEAGFGQHAVRQGDLVLLHYVGSLEDGHVFDSTKGGLKYRDGGPGVFRPVVVRLSGYPQPGICLGLQQAVEGMRIGGKRTVKVPAQLGFGEQTVLAPYAVVPGGSTLQYEIELLRVSSVGPDLLVKGISRCGAGGAGAAADGCGSIEPAEFF